MEKIIASAFMEIAQAIETKQFGPRLKIGITTLGSEHGVENLVKGAEIAAKDGIFDVVLIGPKVETNLEIVEVDCENQAHKKMEELLGNGDIQACVTMHYNFPVGVSTVGRVVTPGLGKEMLIATTTGTSSTNRIEAMIKNAIYGIITSKALGNKNPKVGILNLDGARKVEQALKKLKENGYDIEFADSLRADGGSIMRGNDLLTASADIMVNDTLTGNIMMKVFSSFTTGGSFEGHGYGYGPGVGENYDKIIMILSRASGYPVAANAIRYAYDLAKNNIIEICNKEFEKANSAGLKEIIESFCKEVKKEFQEEIKMPKKEVVTASIAGIDVMDLEEAQKVLWKENIYAESGMGCTGPIIMISELNFEKSQVILQKAGFIS